MSTIINFAKGTTSVVVIPPDFSIANRTVTVVRNSGDNTFRVSVGCQSILITPTNIDQLIYESDFPAIKRIEKQFILPKSGTKKVTPKSPEYHEKSITYLISKSGKLYSKKEYSVVKAEVDSTPKYFKKHVNKTFVTCMVNGNSNSVYLTDMVHVKHVLSVIKKFYVDSNIKTA